VSRDYGLLFVTYPLRPNESLSSLTAESGVPVDLLERYNLGMNFDSIYIYIYKLCVFPKSYHA
jgi:chitin elicitor receptor kinase 1